MILDSINVKKKKPQMYLKLVFVSYDYPSVLQIDLALRNNNLLVQVNVFNSNQPWFLYILLRIV